MLAGFGGLLLLVAATGTGALIVLSRLRTDDAQVRGRFLSRERELDRIRSQIYLSGTYVRDYLLAPDANIAQVQRGRLEALQQDTATALANYGRALEPGERTAFEEMRTQIQAYWNVLDRTFAWTAQERTRERFAFFYEELIPRRTAMLQIADRVVDLNERELKQSDDKVAEVFGRFRFALMATLVIAIAGGFVVAGLTIVYVLRLEGELNQRLAETATAQLGLQELSARLVRAQEDERRALSRELHDEVGQAFSAILMEAGNLLDVDGKDETRPHLESIRGLAEKGMTNIRNMALLLRPSMLDDFGLLPALNYQARETAKRTGLRVTVNAPSLDDELPEEHKTCIYRVVQEALNNCARHAQARAVQVSVESEAGRLVLKVQDDGSGFETRWVRGLGILGMEERVKHLGGAFAVESNPGRGTTVRVELPIAGLNGNGSHPHTAR